MKFRLILFFLILLSSLFVVSATEEVYVVPYVGDIDGHVSEEWLFFYDLLAEFHISNEVPVGISFYPATMIDDPNFMDPFLRMYHDKNIDLIQKGNDGNEEERIMVNLSSNRQREIIKMGRENFREKITVSTGMDEIIFPTSYNQIEGSFDETTLKVAKELGINQYFDLFTSEGLTPVESTDEFNVVQYGVSYSTSGTPSSVANFKSSDEIINQVKTYERRDIEIMQVDGKLVVPLWIHHQDFLSAENPNELNEEKWKIYQETLLRLKEDPEVKLINPSKLYEKIYGIDSHEISLEPISKSVESTTINNHIGICKNHYITHTEFQIDLTKSCNFVYGLFGHESTTNKDVSFLYNHQVNVESIELDQEGICIDRIELENTVHNESLEVEFENSSGGILIKVPEDYYFNKINLRPCFNSSDELNEIVLEDVSFPRLGYKESIEVCTWKGCKRGAVSVTVDDYFSACMVKLEEHGFRGTYYLSNTGGKYDKFTEELWGKFREANEKGHEIATHTQNHVCTYSNKRQYRDTVEKNIEDIVFNIDIEREELISHTYSCGFNTDGAQEVIEDLGILSARGYNLNEFEDQTPNNFYELKSFNDEGYPGGNLDPPDYFELVDIAQREKKWMILSFHSYCNDKEVISHLPGRNVWVGTVGEVISYIHLRDNAVITEYSATNSGIRFNISSEVSDRNIAEELSLRVRVQRDVERISSSGMEIPFRRSKDFGGEYLEFEIPTPVENTVEIIFR